MRSLRKPISWFWNALTAGGNVQFILVTLGGLTVITAVAGGAIWAFASFPWPFKALALLGCAMAFAGLAAEIAPRLAPRFGGVELTMRPSVIAVDRMQAGGQGPFGPLQPQAKKAGFATILVFNSRESGGDRVKACEIVPHLEIFDHDGTRRTEYVGWDQAIARDFSPNREQHRLYVVGKWKDAEDCSIVKGALPENGIGSPQQLGRGTYDVCLTLRGKNLRRPISQWFLLSNQGEEHFPSLSKAGG